MRELGSYQPVSLLTIAHRFLCSFSISLSGSVLFGVFPAQLKQLHDLRRGDLIVRIVGRGENHIDLSRREPGQCGIDVDIERSEFAQFQLQDFQIPAGIERDLVVSDPEARIWVAESPERIIVGTSVQRRCTGARTRSRWFQRQGQRGQCLDFMVRALP